METGKIKSKLSKASIMAFLVIILSAFTGIVFFEAIFSFFPSLLPHWYKESLPAYGIELFKPDVLKKTPIEGVPVPLPNSPLYTGQKQISTLPKDLEDLSMVDSKDNPDASLNLELILPVDSNGFANKKVLEKADVLLIGDSFTFALGVTKPEGFLEDFKRKTGLSIYNMGISDTGPIKQKWVLENLGLKMEPELVLWFIFMGNDLSDGTRTINYIKTGITNYENLYAHHKRPTFHTLSLIMKLFSFKNKNIDSIPGAIFQGTKGNVPIWFYPHYLRSLENTWKDWTNDPGWQVLTETITQVKGTLDKKDIDLAIVYVPTKASVYLPFVKIDKDLLHKMAFFGEKNKNLDNSEFYNLSLRNSKNAEITLEDFCRRNNIAFFSTAGPLKKAAASGLLVYLSADTHWLPQGQKQFTEPIVKFLKERSFLKSTY